ALTAEEYPTSLASPFGEIAFLALGTGDADGNRLGGFAFRIAGASEKPAETAPLDHHRPTALFTFLVGDLFLHHHDLPIDLLEVLGVLALRVTSAGQKATHLAPLDHHRVAALFADHVGLNLLPLDVPHFHFRLGEVPLEGAVEIVENFLPIGLAVGD